MKYIICVAALFACCAQGMDGIESLEKRKLFESIIVTPTNLTIRFSEEGQGHRVSYPDHRISIPSRGTHDYVKKNEALVLTPDKRVNIFEFHGCFAFTPVTFKNQGKGFRIMETFDARSLRGGLMTNSIAYVALSDTPVQVGEDDVEMILENGEWVKFKREVEAQDTPPSRKKNVTVTNDETPVNVAEDEPSEEKNKTNMFWLCVVIFHCLLAILWLARKKRKRETKN